MANLSKKKVLELLAENNISTDGITDYQVLCKMLKDATPVQVEPKPVKMKTVKAVGQTMTIPKDLYKRARKVVGMSDSQIVAQQDTASLKAFCDRVSPGTNPDALPKEVPTADRNQAGFVDAPPESVEFDSKLEAKNMSCNRLMFDESSLQVELRKINRKYGARTPIRIVLDRGMKAVYSKNKDNKNAKMLVTHYTVFYK